MFLFLKKPNNVKVENESPPSQTLVPKASTANTLVPVLPDVYFYIDVAIPSDLHVETFLGHSGGSSG